MSAVVGRLRHRLGIPTNRSRRRVRHKPDIIIGSRCGKKFRRGAIYQTAGGETPECPRIHWASGVNPHLQCRRPSRGCTYADEQKLSRTRSNVRGKLGSRALRGLPASCGAPLNWTSVTCRHGAASTVKRSLTKPILPLGRQRVCPAPQVLAPAEPNIGLGLFETAATKR